MNIIFIASEATPYVKTGGLGDVVGTLPKYLKRLGLNVSLLIPLYKTIKEGNFNLERIYNFEIDIGDKNFQFNIFKDIKNSDYDVFFFDNEYFFNRKGLYNENNVDYPDNDLRFGAFSLAALKFSFSNLEPDIIHCHDWQTSFVPIFKNLYYNNISTKTILTIHNLAYQGIFDFNSLVKLSLPIDFFSIDKLEFYGNVNYLKGGIIFSDFITTVSPTYAKEIQKLEFGFGLDGVLREKRDKLIGILNGIDFEHWNPETDKMIYKNYNLNTINNKRKNKEELFKELNINFSIEKPLFSMITRITSQKGLDLVLKSFIKIINLPLNLIILGMGDKDIEDELIKLGDIYKDKFKPIIKFDEELSHKIYAASDFFVMPSKFEPCGLSQMISLRYGTIPIVRSTGGLKDTVIEYNDIIKCGNGFVFFDYDHIELFEAINRAIKVFNEKEKLNKIIKIGMSCDFSWERSSIEYLNLYRNIKK